MRLLFLIFALSALCVSARSADAGAPTYLIIQPADGGGHTAGYAVPTTKRSYAWGFFGAQPRKHVYWQSGYYGDYHQRVVIEPFRK